MGVQKPKFGLVRPTSEPRTDTRLHKAAMRVEQGEARIVVQVSIERHTALKAHAATLGKSIREYVLEVLEQAGAFGEK